MYFFSIIGNILKDFIFFKDIRLRGFDNFYLWKYLMIWVVKCEKFWFLFDDVKFGFFNSNVIEDFELDDKKEMLLYIMIMFIKFGVLKNFIIFKDF